MQITTTNIRHTGPAAPTAFDAAIAGAPGARVAADNGTAAPARTEQVALTARAAERNPYEGVAPGFSSVTVGRWGSGGNDSLVGILNSQGYSSADVYRRNAEGRTLIDEVTRVNNLRNPNMIRQGQALMVPSQTARPSARPAAPQARPAAGAAGQAAAARSAARPAAQAAEQPNVNEVRVDRFNRGPNDTLFNILRNQGFSRQEILSRDASGDSLMNRIARANNLESPDRITAGSTLNIPNNMAAVGQMNIPARPQAAPAPRPAAPAAPVVAATPAAPIAPAAPSTPAAPAGAPAAAAAPTAYAEQPTANMGLLLDGVRGGQFKRNEFQFLNAMSNRYDETRAQYARDGFTNEELSALGNYERNYGAQFARLHSRDDVVLRDATSNSQDPKAQVRIRHYNEAGQLWDNLQGNTTNTEGALQIMLRQQAEARTLGAQ